MPVIQSHLCRTDLDAPHHKLFDLTVQAYLARSHFFVAMAGELKNEGGTQCEV